MSIMPDPQKGIGGLEEDISKNALSANLYEEEAEGV